MLREIGKIPAHRISDEATLDSDLKMESVALIEIQVALEDRFNIEIDVIEVVQINRLGGIVDYILALVSDTAWSERVSDS